MDFSSRSFREWSIHEFTELFEVYQPQIDILEQEYREKIKTLDTTAHDYRYQLKKEKGILFKNKREVLQPFIIKMYDDVFDGIGNVTVKITHAEHDWVKNWVDNSLLKRKWFEPGRQADGHNMSSRQLNGSIGEYGVIKFLGGSEQDFNMEVGASKDFADPDLEKFLDGRKAGVKAAIVGSKSKIGANFPLINYDPTNRIIEAQVLVGQTTLYRNKNFKYKYYVIGVVKPEDIVRYLKALFTLDPDAHHPDKRGGPKFGFWNLIKSVPFRTKSELIALLDSPEFQPMEI